MSTHKQRVRKAFQYSIMDHLLDWIMGQPLSPAEKKATKESYSQISILVTK